MESITKAVKAIDILVRPLSLYYVAGTAKPGLLFGYANVPDEQIKPLFMRLVDLIVAAVNAAIPLDNSPL